TTGSGAPTGTTETTTRTARGVTPQDLPRARPAFCGAAVGTASASAAGRPGATAASRRTGTSTSAFASSWSRRNEGGPGAMRVFLTGGSGDLGQVLSGQLESRGDVPVRFDVREPLGGRGLYVNGSILDREALQKGLEGTDCVVHIAAWHGIHEA